MKLIPLTQGQFSKVDDEDYDKLNQHKWYAHWSKKTQSYYAIRRGWDKEKKRAFTIQMGREIMNTPDDVKCDHISHETLDNQKINLRNVTNSQNSMNSRTNKNNKLGVKGVSIDRGKYRPHIMINRKQYHLGSYSTLEEAIRVRKEAEERLHGEFRLAS